jgi:hypothetical protein
VAGRDGFVLFQFRQLAKDLASVIALREIDKMTKRASKILLLPLAEAH